MRSVESLSLAGLLLAALLSREDEVVNRGAGERCAAARRAYLEAIY